MTERSFLDTSVLVYSDDRASGKKQAVARDLIRRGIRSGKAVLSTQVLQEYFVSAVRKLGIPARTARRKVSLYGTRPVIVVQLDLITQAIDLHLLHQVSFWDALVIRAAREGGCRVLYTEDLQHGQDFDGVRVENPFRHLP